MSRISIPVMLFLLVLVWLAVIVTDMLVHPLTLSYSGAWVYISLLPGLAVFGWPLGLWLWHKAQVETSRVESAPLYALAVLSWILATVAVIAYIRSWVFT